jgi:cation/acetate symporter
MTTFFGFGAAALLDGDLVRSNPNMSAPLLAKALAGDLFFAFISAVAFATILAVVAGLTISASTSFAHDFFTNVIHHGKEHRPGEEVKVARITAFVVGAASIAIAILLGPKTNVAYLVGLAFAVAASANLPVILMSVFWKRFTTAGAVWGLGVGLVASILFILIGPNVMGENAIFPLQNPGIASIPLGLLAAWLGSLASPHEHGSEAKFAEMKVRAHTGHGAEQAEPH